MLSRRLTKTTTAILARGFASSAARAKVNKVYPSAAEAVKAVKSGDTILAGGFGLCG
jgi:3-oxoacid CoA-transferase